MWAQLLVEPVLQGNARLATAVSVNCHLLRIRRGFRSYRNNNLRYAVLALPEQIRGKTCVTCIHPFFGM
jgi:hypothetical protein